MRGLTLTQPWASLVALEAKRIETRSWSTPYRGPIAIHAAKGPGALGSYKAMRDLCGTQPFFDALMATVPNYNEYCDRDAIFEQLPMGAIVAVVDLYHCVPTEDLLSSPNGDYWGIDAQLWTLDENERAFGDYSPGRYGWLLNNVRRLDRPIPCHGALSLWHIAPERCVSCGTAVGSDATTIEGLRLCAGCVEAMGQEQ